MAISFNHKVKNNVLTVFTYGVDESLEDSEKYAYDVFQLCMLNKCDRILCDERELDYSLSVIDTFLLAEYASINARGLIKLAIVCQEKYMNEAKFYETVSTNRGLTVIVTSDIDYAIDWLK